MGVAVITNVWACPGGGEARPLHHAEAVLLVDHGDPEFSKIHPILDDGMRADDQLHGSGGDLLPDRCAFVR